MTWFRVDDSLAFHSKVVGVGNHALGLWLRSGAWSAQQLTDGVVPAHMVTALGGTRRHAQALVAFGLWEDMNDGTYLFHDWEKYQPTSAEVKAERLARSEAKALAGRAGGIASGVSRRANKEAGAKQNEAEPEADDEANGNQNEAPSLPYPSLPSGTRKRATTAPDIFPITDAMTAWGREHAPLVADPATETRQFLDYHRAKGSTMKDWTAAWRTWMTTAQKFALERQQKATEPEWKRLGRQGDWDV